MRIDIDIHWRPLVDASGCGYRYPEPLNADQRLAWRGPAVYRWLVVDAETQVVVQLYVGETENLARRVGGYLRPGPSQTTNIRVAALFAEELAGGRVISLETLTFAPFRIGDALVTMDHLREKSVRRFLEGLCETQFRHAGYDVVNA